MSLEFHNGEWRQMCPGCGARGCPCKWEQGALYLSCTNCDSEFCFRPKARSEGRGGVGQALGWPECHLSLEEGRRCKSKRKARCRARWSGGAGKARCSDPWISM